jgi:hypothetical protein
MWWEIFFFNSEIWRRILESKRGVGLKPTNGLTHDLKRSCGSSFPLVPVATGWTILDPRLSSVLSPVTAAITFYVMRDPRSIRFHNSSVVRRGASIVFRIQSYDEGSLTKTTPSVQRAACLWRIVRPGLETIEPIDREHEWTIEQSCFCSVVQFVNFEGIAMRACDRREFLLRCPIFIYKQKKMSLIRKDLRVWFLLCYTV